MTFISFPKLYRLRGPIIITEKIDGTNAQILITADGDIKAGSRTRWITPAADNHGFARWVEDNKTNLITWLGEGRHYGEWWGKGIQRGYNLNEKRFSLFDTRWRDRFNDWQKSTEIVQLSSIGVSVVPILYVGVFNTAEFDRILAELKITGSLAAPGYMNPEGIVIYDTQSGTGFKKTYDYDETGKGGIRDKDGNVL